MVKFLRSSATGWLTNVWSKLALLHCAAVPLMQEQPWPLSSPGLAAFQMVALICIGIVLVEVRKRGPEWQGKEFPSVLKEMPPGWKLPLLWGSLTTLVAPFWVMLGGSGEWPDILYWMFLANCLAASVAGMWGDVLWNKIFKERAAA